MAQDTPVLMSRCRQCGGSRYHSTLAEETRLWDEEDVGEVGGDIWAIIECCGCRTVTLSHSHWIGSDYTYDQSGNAITAIDRDLYPLSSARKIPEWGAELFFAFNEKEWWIARLHKDLYSALALNAYGLVAMGARAILDFVVTSRTGEKGNFKEKLSRLAEKTVITEAQVTSIFAAFDAGSAAAHRGHSPTWSEVYTQLDIIEDLLDQLYITPTRRRRQIKEAAALVKKTPQRARPIKPPS
ncbi:DUF4145 domain-containing protein [Acidisoma sp. L85]|uniref:DUF4145 domain-containing protein n=1 Tax=Acidisoma sp. L85 TaxID=1641850 RepID=UPI00131B22AB|nr:DUF4145 domain-containing protein [Acidisoma sp. L85]